MDVRVPASRRRACNHQVLTLGRLLDLLSGERLGRGWSRRSFALPARTHRPRLPPLPAGQLTCSLFSRVEGPDFCPLPSFARLQNGAKSALVRTAIDTPVAGGVAAALHERWPFLSGHCRARTLAPVRRPTWRSRVKSMGRSKVTNCEHTKVRTVRDSNFAASLTLPSRRPPSMAPEGVPARLVQSMGGGAGGTEELGRKLCSLTLSGQQQRGRPHALRCSPASSSSPDCKKSRLSPQLTHLLSPAGPLLLATADKACKRWSVGAVLEGYAFDDIHTLQLRSRPRVSAVSCRAAEVFRRDM